jgi:hypothetical protein
MLQLLVTANVPSSQILVTMMMEALSSYDMSVLTRATRRHTPEDDILRSHRREYFKSYTDRRVRLKQDVYYTRRLIYKLVTRCRMPKDNGDDRLPTAQSDVRYRSRLIREWSSLCGLSIYKSSFESRVQLGMLWWPAQCLLTFRYSPQDLQHVFVTCLQGKFYKWDMSAGISGVSSKQDNIKCFINKLS